MLYRNWEKIKRLKKKETLQKKLDSLQQKDCQRPEKVKGAETSSKLSERKMRRAGGNTIAHLREKGEKDFKLREEELKLR